MTFDTKEEFLDMRMSDIIEAFINDMVEESGVAKIQRNELAERFNCVPSQINYVISTRFSPEHGYLVESRRGGGGYVLIRRVDLSDVSLIMHTVNSIGESVSQNEVIAIVGGLYNSNAISKKEANIIVNTLSDSAMGDVAQSIRGNVRAKMLKRALLAVENSD